MYVVIKNKFKRTGPLVMGGENSGRYELALDRLVENIEDIEEGEMYSKIHLQKQKDKK